MVDSAPSPDFPMCRRFRRRRLLGEGTWGAVYEVEDTERDAVVAMKVLRPMAPATIAQLRKTLRTFIELDHPHLVTLNALFRLDDPSDRWFFTMERVVGAPFVLPGSGRLRRALADLAAGVSAIHAQGQLHGALKPTNALVTEAGPVVLLDFAMPPLPDRGVSTAVQPYRAPELDEGLGPSPASDWYAVGAMLYRALTGRAPFEGSNGAAKARSAPERPTDPRLPPDLVRLSGELLAPIPSDRPTGQDVLQRLGIRRRTRPRPARAPDLVGRTAALEALDGELERIKRGTATVVHVMGAAGVGKSAVVEAWAPRAQARGLVFSARCYAHERVPLKAMDGLMEAIGAHLRTLPAEQAALILPPGIRALAARFPVLPAPGANEGPRPPPPSGDHAVDSAVAAFRSLLFALGRTRPIVLIVDDLHLADLDSGRWLAAALGPPEPPPVLLVVSHPGHDDGPQALVGTSVPDGFQVVRLPLGPLSPSDAEALALERLAAERDPADLADPFPIMAPHERTALARTIADESAGVPLFIDELARLRSATTSGPRALSIDGVVLLRADRLDEAAAELLRVLAIAGAPLPVDVALRAARLPAHDPTPVDALVQAGLARRREADALEPFHRRVAPAIVTPLSAATRQRLHAQLATALARNEDGDPTLLITHLAGAGKTTDAADVARRAARRERARSATLRGDAEAPGGPRYATHKARAKRLEAAGNPEAGRAYVAAAELSTGVVRREMLRRAAEQMLRFGQVDEGLRRLAPVLRALDLTPPTSPRRVLARWAEARQRIESRGLGWTEADGPPPFEAAHAADACWTAAVGLATVDALTSALYATRYLIAAMDLGDPNRVARGLAMELAVRSASGPPSAPRLREVLEPLRALAKRIDSPYARGFASLAAGLAALYEGRWAEASQCSQNAERVFVDQCAAVDWEVAAARTLGAWAESQRGRFAGQRAVLEAHIGHAIARLNPLGALMLRASPSANIVWLAADDPAAATRALDEATRDVPQVDFHWSRAWLALSWTQLDLYTGQGPSAHRRIVRHWPRLATSGAWRVQLHRAEARFLRARAALAAAREGARPLLAQARADAAQLREEGPLYCGAYGLLVDASALSALGLTSEAQHQFEEAEDAARRAEMAVVAAVAAYRRAESEAARDRAERGLAELGVRNPRAMVGLLAP